MTVPAATGELDFLRFFFEAAGEAFGPADHDVYCGIMQQYEDENDRLVPEEYRIGYLSREDDNEEES